MAEKQLACTVSHYYSKIGVAVIDLESDVQKGDQISIEGATTNIQQPVDSMQVEHGAVATASKGDSIGLKVKDRVRPGDKVYKIVE